jgi:hypothetical protein
MDAAYDRSRARNEPARAHPGGRESLFGVDYNVGLMRWIGENYRLSADFDSANSRNAKLGD